MATLRTDGTEIITGLAMLGHPTLERALSVRPRAVMNVADSDFDRLDEAFAADEHVAEFTTAWDNGVVFAQAADGLRGRPPWRVEWKGPHKPPDYEQIPADLRVDVYRASGAGGQHVNRTESAVRLTHNPTGIVVACQAGRSQHQNKDQAMKQLKAKLFELEMQKRNEEKQKAEDSKSDIGWGSQIRSYVLDDSRIKDLRTKVETSNTQSVLDGDIDKFIEASLKMAL